MARPDVQSYTLLEPRSETATSTSSPARQENDRGQLSEFLGKIAWPSPALVDEENFQVFIGLVIFLNIVVLWGETDLPHLSIWVVFDNIFLAIFLVEIVMRIMHKGWSEYYLTGKDKAWAYLDTAIVCLGVFDLWVTPLFLAEFRQAGSAKSSLLRFLRLMRLLRLLRVFRMIPKLQGFVNALWNMFGTFIWIFGVLFLFILCFAIMLTHLLGHAEALGDREYLEREHNEALHLVMTYFQDVPTSLFTLFQLTTTDNWDRIAKPLVEINPWWRLFFVFFISFASWTMISVLTAVASTNMIEATSDRKENQLREQEQRHKQFLSFLHESFLEADIDGNGLLDKDEFKALMEKDFVHRQMKDLGIHLTQEELFKAWDMLDIDESGELTIEEFVTGLSYLQEGLSTKHIVNVDYSLKRVTIRCEDRMTKIGATVKDIVRQNEEIVAKLAKREQNPETLEQHEHLLWLWQQWALRSEFGGYCRRQLRAMGT
mmetsp:Transcript_16436/g.38517  ORF Transcript_16436/g.38517 Transcript_16436/m.38517 type:complete len:487 (+) Transcript_16436:100-1560(+)